MDTSYTALARRFRPQTFTEVVGQERIAQTLRNAIVDGRVAHAYLFTGARGVGKTSMARIFSKALNCPQAVEGVPCNDCEICRGIAAGQDVDVVEIDGASNRGIDDIRSLRANVNVRSMRSPYKIYIIDEVHMLTKEAFNALLKTLEEPPPKVKFVFCTTEPNKLPDTILSRCQRFDFGTIPLDGIKTRLSQLADAEGFTVEPAALELVARRANGSMRDSQSLFDQLLAFGARTITADDVHRLLGTAPDQRLIDLVGALIARDPKLVLEQLQVALGQGVQLDVLVEQLLNYLRDLMVLAVGADDVRLSSIGAEFRQELQTQASQWGLQTIVAALQLLADTKARMSRVTFGRTLAELGLVRICQLADLERIEHLVAVLKGQVPPVGGSAASSARPIAAPSQGALQTKTPATEKKNEQPIRPASVPVTQDVSGKEVAEEKVVPVLAWAPGCEQELLTAMQQRATGMLRPHLSKIASSAISGPNRLDLRFSASYDLARKACERPETLQQIQAIVRELTGETVRIQLLSVPDEISGVEKPVTNSAANAAAARRKLVEDPEDSLVQDVGKVFGISSWYRQDILAPSTAADEALVKE